MTVTNVHTDTAARTLTISASYEATPGQVWQLWADPRLLERWWGPPTYPATVVEHDLTPGGRVTYVMTGPEGDRHAGWWRVLAVHAPHSLEYEDGFADAGGEVDPSLPVTFARVTIAASDDGLTVMTIASTFPTTEAMEQLVAMGMVEGMTLALGQTDALLAATAATA
jgi:uncharacterized protein YndB with AHSA1/START domain